MATEMNLIKRLKAETPKFFKQVIKISLTLSAFCGAIITAPTLLPALVLSPIIITICQYSIVFGLGMAAISKTTMVYKPIKK